MKREDRGAPDSRRFGKLQRICCWLKRAGTAAVLAAMRCAQAVLLQSASAVGAISRFHCAREFPLTATAGGIEPLGECRGSANESATAHATPVRARFTAF